MTNISVIIPVYNAEKYIEKAVASVLQFQEVQEVLLIDDGSKDRSLEICTSLAQKHPQIKVFTHPDNQNRGVSASRNLGIDNATKEFITFLDADDYWLPNRFDAEREIFKDQKIDGVFGAISTEFVSERGKAEYLSKFGNQGLTTVNYHAEGRKVYYGLVEKNKNFGTFFSMIGLTVRKTALENPKRRLSENMAIGEDKDFTIKLAYEKNLKTGIIDQPIAVRTAHENNSITKIKNHTSVFFQHNTVLYQALYHWSKTKKEMPPDIVEVFRYKYLSFKLAANSGLKKYLLFLQLLPFNPKLLKTRYRYFALKNNPKE
ncbi:glycosyltransferase family 2 protein [Kaistella faecalis]|uniref:glycosyltransferase family 2 protein n=1 Tax=Kaistella faecalis TaxID=2852098 RepID=UPI001C448BCC|nr:glycosyltransferase family 2 protein [Chryseobacterium faecale]UFK98853.1 glycosyltransferase family 2 protein [Chryseobacterium faecale]